MQIVVKVKWIMGKIYQTQKNMLKTDKESLMVIEKLSYHCWKMYNVGLYSVKQYHKSCGEYLNYVDNYHICKNSEHYQCLLTDSGQQILRLVDRNMKSFFALLKLKNSGKYSDPVNPPGYKQELCSIVIQGRSARIRDGYVLVGLSSGFKKKYNPKIKCLKFKLPKNIKVDKLKELRIIPKFGGKHYEIEFVYEVEYETLDLNKENALGIDLGVSNFATCFSYQGDGFILDGRKLKSVNQLYNKILGKTQKCSNKRIRNSIRRNNKINDIFNKYVKYIIDYCVSSDIGTIDVGILNKSKVNIGKTNNQNFCSIPYRKFISKLQSKCTQLGIELHLQDESYTSKCSFLDKEEVQKQDIYLGKRTKRGLFKTSQNIFVNADLNGAANLLKKCNRRLTERASSGFVTNPLKIYA